MMQNDAMDGRDEKLWGNRAVSGGRCVLLAKKLATSDTGTYSYGGK